MTTPGQTLVSGIRITVFADRDAAERAAADVIAGLLVERRLRGLACVLGLATGHTPVGIYRELVSRHRAREAPFAHCETFNLDEYWPIGLRDPGSFHRFMHEHLFDHVDIPRGKRHVPDGTTPEAELDAKCRDYEARIRAAGGIDLQLLGVGRNGHIGFNEPGSTRDSRTRRVALSAETLADNRSSFPAGGTTPIGTTGEAGPTVPTQAITMGIATILEARRILVLAFGERKAATVRNTLLGPIGPTVPASFLREHGRDGGSSPNVDLFLDVHAAAAL